MDKYHEAVMRNNPYCSIYSCGCEEEIMDEDSGDEGEEEELPEELLAAAEEGETERIQAYLDEDCDVNALCNEESLLSRACNAGQLNVVKLLLQHPDIHLNPMFEGRTPILRAARNGHTECVKLILNSECKCQLNLKNTWPNVINILKQKPQLSQNSTMYILDLATREAQWEAVHLLLQTDHHIIEEICFVVILKATLQNKWDIVNEVFKRKFNCKSEIINNLLGVTVLQRNWEKVEKVLQMKDKKLKLELPLMEAALNEDTDEVQKLLTERNYSAQTLNGCLLVVAAGGTSEPIAQLMMAIRETYNHETLSDALHLACLGLHSELFSPLLCNPEGCYTLHDLARARRTLGEVSYHAGEWRVKEKKGNFMEVFLDKALENKTKSLFPQGCAARKD